MRKTFPDDPSIRFLAHEDDSIFSERGDRSIASFGIDAKRTRPGSPWQNGTVERWIGTMKRGLLDGVVALDEPHLRRLLREYVDCHCFAWCEAARSCAASIAEAVG